ncbi:MAG: hypothetical protein HC892_20790 [Saprospiraceae bacterium]|nr:hypothetical protein [Saprospiraceae bacterium]
MTKLIFGSMLCLLLQTTLAFAQTPDRKTEELVAALNNTEFVQQYQTHKESIELDIAEFKLEESTLDATEVKRVQLYYDQSRLKFDAILNKLQTDLTSRTKRKTILDNPTAYTKTLQDDLTAALDYYNENCKKRIEALLEKDSAMDTETLQELLGGVLGMVQLLKEKSDLTNQLNTEYLKEAFINPLRLKKWAEL